MPTTDATAQPPPAERADRVYRVLQSLRTSFIRIGVVALIFSIGGYYLAESILRLLQRLTGVRLAAYGIPETFFSFLNLGLAFGVFASMPYILYAILDGVQPLYPTLNRRMMRGFWLAAVVLLKFWKPKQEWHFPDEPPPTIHAEKLPFATVARAWAGATMSANKPSTSCWWRWTALKAAKA